MKKLLSLIFLIPLLLSCEINQQNQIESVNVSVRQVDWHPSVAGDGTNLFYFCTVNMPEITQNVYSNGIVQVYYTWNNLTSQGQQPLPYVMNHESATNYKWLQTVDFEYSPGTITIYSTRSDFIAEIPSAMNFRIVVMK